MVTTNEPQLEDKDYLSIAIRFEGAWRYMLFGLWKKFGGSILFEHEWHKGEFVMFPDDDFEKYFTSATGLFLAKAVRYFVKAKVNPITLESGALIRAQFLQTKELAKDEKNCYQMMFVGETGGIHCIDFQVEGKNTASSISCDLGSWKVDAPEDSILLEVENLENNEFAPTLLSILYMHKAKCCITRERRIS